MARTFSYDMENRQTTATVAGIGNTYKYDGEGRRVISNAWGQTTVHVYDAFGQLAASYGPDTATGTAYLTADALGSTRLIVPASTGPVQNFDYFPFGAEIPSATAGRDSSFPAGYPVSPGGMPLKCTGKERDAETGLDYFESRYYSAAQGRFTSPDEFKGGIVDPFTGQDIETNTALPYADITDPQTLNKYAYVRNNPLTFTDPSGLGIFGDIFGAIGAGLGFLACGPPCAMKGFGLGEFIGGSVDVARSGDIRDMSPLALSTATNNFGLGNPGSLGGGLNGLIWGNRNPFIIDNFSDSSGQWQNGRQVMPDGDTAIYGIGGGQGGAVLGAVYHNTKAIVDPRQKIVDCAKAGYGARLGIGVAGGGMIVAGQPWLSAGGKFGGATAGTSVASKFFRGFDALKGKAPEWVGKLFPTAAGGTRAATWGGTLGRAVPWVGVGLLAADYVSMGTCVASF